MRIIYALMVVGEHEEIDRFLDMLQKGHVIETVRGDPHRSAFYCHIASSTPIDYTEIRDLCYATGEEFQVGFCEMSRT